jgi:glycosyltransferase involved in cell wall biosynthesis
VICTDQSAIGNDPQRIRALIQGIWNRRAAQSMANILRGFDPGNTVVHVHGWTKALSSSVIKVAIDHRFKVVCTLHDYFSACPNGSFFNYQKNAVCELRPLSGACVSTQCDRQHYGHKIWRLVRQYTQNSWGGMPKDVHHFIMVSEVSRIVLRPYFSPDSQMYFVQNPVRAAYAEPVDISRNSAYLMVGRIAQEKGPHIFAEAARMAGCEAVLVGDGDKCAEVLRLCPSATMLGWLAHEAVMAELRKARALVFPSLLFETDGLSVVEAAALGIPAIVSDVSAARASIVDGVTGLLFKAGDPKDLAEKMSALRDDETGARMGRAAHAHYWKNPRTLERHVQELEHTYEQVLAC